MRNGRLPGRCVRVLAVVSIVALLGTIAWLVVEARMVAEDAHALHLRDWPFAVCFSVFLVATYLALAIFLSLRVRKRWAAVLLSVAMLFPIGYIAKTGFGLKGFLFGSKAYSNAEVYVKSYFAWEPDYYFEYTPDGPFRIRDGKCLGFGGGTMADYIEHRESE